MIESADQIDADQVVAHPDKFKASLGIGKHAYKILIAKDRLSDMLKLVGAGAVGWAAAKSSVFATTFGFSSGGILGLFTAAVTPVGLVAAVSVVTAGTCYGVMRLNKKIEGEFVDVVPKYINTPLDVLAVSLCDLIMPIALKVAAADGEITDEEREVLKKYLVDDWGYDSDYVDAVMKLFEEGIDKYTIQDITSNLHEFTENSKDCNREKIRKGLVDTLDEIALVDGERHEMEKLVIDHIDKSLQGDSSVKKLSSKIKLIAKYPFKKLCKMIKSAKN